MLDNIWLIPLLPFVSAVVLILTAGKLPKSVVASMGAGSIGLSALVVFGVAYAGAKIHVISYSPWFG